ncbi:MAG: hypothetical protein J6I96_03100 [Oscillospiraceae bacterium]|nr:hypothetical protein [Oscillospiraceae bacterium]
MQGAYFIFLLLFILILASRKKKRRMTAAAFIKNRRKKGKKIMGEILNAFIGKEVVIYTINDQSSMVSGVVESVTDNWVTVRAFDSEERQVVNLEYVMRVREYPRDKNGKRKVIFD